MKAWVERRPLLAALAGLAILLAVAVALELGFGVSPDGADGAPARAAAPPDAKLLPPVVAQAPEHSFPRWLRARCSRLPGGQRPPIPPRGVGRSLAASTCSRA